MTDSTADRIDLQFWRFTTRLLMLEAALRARRSEAAESTGT